MSRSVTTNIFRLPNISSRIAASSRPAVPKILIMTNNNRALNSQSISEITAREKELTGQDRPVAGGPTAQAQKHANQPVSSDVVSDVTQGEKRVTGRGVPVSGGPAAHAQSIASSTANPAPQHTGKLDSHTISAIHSAEKKLTGQDQPVKGGPTAQAQSHANEPINSQNLHDITEGEKQVTGGQRVKGGPTATAQSELVKSRS
ncbi:hypothetical protein F5Y00DRAFT_257621 [Daldinia vernicosa]|uniref:uncharacterized protein n=1 Tax=Daldinia vernicosa TaxID=114800 RepID=UPI002008225B|nr:uncharacterized protein F5Y00DRAFT_257621 [Daldinia vernicosa]KAI0853601.1 hypothetical protein F5Y00DRAFT_257621 [Daldinia vernicosa]